MVFHQDFLLHMFSVHNLHHMAVKRKNIHILFTSINNLEFQIYSTFLFSTVMGLFLLADLRLSIAKNHILPGESYFTTIFFNVLKQILAFFLSAG